MSTATQPMSPESLVGTTWRYVGLKREIVDVRKDPSGFVVVWRRPGKPPRNPPTQWVEFQRWLEKAERIA